MRYLIFSLVFLVFSSIIGFGWVFDRIYEQYIVEESHPFQGDKAHYKTIGLSLGNALDKLNINSIEQTTRNKFIDEWNSNSHFQLRLLSREDFALPDELVKLIESENELILESERYIDYYYLLQSQVEIFNFRVPKEPVKTESIDWSLIFTLIFYFVVLLVLLLWLYPLIRRLVAMRKVSQSFGEGNLSERIELGKISYIRDIETEFNRMADRIENLVSDVKLLSSAFSHDLRTPLSRIRMGFDTLSEEENKATRKEYEERISRNIDQMSELIDSLLGYARLECSVKNYDRELVEFNSLLKEIVALKEPNLIHVETTLENKVIHVKGSKNYLKMLLNNLIDNAIKHGKDRVIVRLSMDDNKVELSVSDNGVGIKLEDKADVFNPFVKAKSDIDETYSRDNRLSRPDGEGFGLGLAIAKRISDWHKGSIHLENSKSLGGAKFVLRLPVVNPPA